MNILILAVTALLLVPIAVLCAECLAALLPRRKRRATPTERSRVTVLIPAHNEEKVLAVTLCSLTPQLRSGDRLIVVADNCTDRTAAIAREHGAEVIERSDAVRRGKGYALDFGIRHLESDPPGIVVMMDADCVVHEGAIDALAAQVVETGKPAQAVYLLERPSSPRPKDLVSALAFMVKNLVRPSGLGRLGLPCLLTGTGMAFPWSIISNARLASGNIVEDMQLGLDLALEGFAPQFCENARVTGRLPDHTHTAFVQRTRWEHGHLQTLIVQVPRLVAGAFKKGRMSALALAAELSVPPLSLLMLIFVTAIGGTVLAACLGASWAAANLLMGGCALTFLCLFAVWAKFGREQLPITALLAAPFYMAWKFPMYLAFLFKPQREWVRTDRSDDSLIKVSPSSPLHDSFPAMEQPTVIDLCGVNVHAITERECINLILRRSITGRGGVVVTPNLDHLRRCRKDTEFARLVKRADLAVADGMPLVWASRLQGTPLPGRVAGSDLISSLSAAAAEHGKSIFLLGGDPGTAESAAKVLRQRHPQIKIAGTYCPSMGFETNADMMAELTRTVLEARPDIVFVALGSPKQERLIDRLRDRLPGAWWLGVGISFSFLCGDVKRAPRWMRKIGLEWVHRLIQEPGRLAKRYLFQGIPFASRLLLGAMGRGIARKFGRGLPERSVAVNLGGGLGNIQVRVNESDFASEAPLQFNRTSRMNGDHSGNGQYDGNGNGHAHVNGNGHSNGNGNGNGNGHSNGNGKSAGPEMLYKSFLSGFASEFFVSDPTPGMIIKPMTHANRFSGMLCDIKAVVLLGGSVRHGKLANAIERSLLSLPLEDGRSILTHWRDEAASLRRLVGIDQLPVRVMVDRNGPQPAAPSPSDEVAVVVEQDLSPYRGTGGVLRDISADYQDNDVLVVANGAQALFAPLSDLVRALAEFDSDVSLVAHADGTPSGLMLVRCRALRKLAASGYLDMKEQALPAIAREFKVTHLFQTHATGMPVRNMEEYITALQRRYRASLGKPAPSDPFAEDRRPTFAIVEEGAVIHPDARVHDSVILKGAYVESGAMVVRSIVCPGGALGEGQTAVDQLVVNAEVAAR